MILNYESLSKTRCKVFLITPKLFNFSRKYRAFNELLAPFFCYQTTFPCVPCDGKHLSGKLSRPFLNFIIHILWGKFHFGNSQNSQKITTHNCAKVELCKQIETRREEEDREREREREAYPCPACPVGDGNRVATNKFRGLTVTYGTESGGRTRRRVHCCAN